MSCPRTVILELATLPLLCKCARSESSGESVVARTDWHKKSHGINAKGVVFIWGDSNK